MYADSYSEEIVKKLIKLNKRDPAQYLQLRKKMDQIISSTIEHHKFLSHDMVGLNRVHLGHFVLVFRVDEKNNTIHFEDYDHHDNIYSK